MRVKKSLNQVLKNTLNVQKASKKFHLKSGIIVNLTTNTNLCCCGSKKC